MTHRRYFRNADITIQVDSDLPIEDTTFDKAVSSFAVPEPGEEIVTIRHHFSLPDIDNGDLGQELYKKPPWAIYKKDDSWIYLGITSFEKDTKPFQISVFNKDYSQGLIYNGKDLIFRAGGHNSLCLYPTDQVLIARILADRAGFYLHSAGVIYHGNGLLFVGHSEAGKSTMVKMLKDRTEILCDDRIILRKQNGKWNIHGTWSHGEMPDVSPGSAPLAAIFFLEKAPENDIIPLDNKEEALVRLLGCVIKPLVDAGWWAKTLLYVEDVGINIPCFRLLFDKSGRVIPLIESLFMEIKSLTDTGNHS
jgi:hypothetical protein